MKEIILDIADYKVVINLQKKIISFVCRETAQEHDMKESSYREYDLPSQAEVIKVNADVEEHDTMRYITINFDDNTFLQVKLESRTDIVLDHWETEGDIIEEMGAWCFWD